MKFLKWHITNIDIKGNIDARMSKSYWDGHSAGWNEREGAAKVLALLDEGQTVMYFGLNGESVMEPNGSCTWRWKPKEIVG